MARKKGKNVLTYKDLFGKKIKIITSHDPGLRGLEGVFYDETLKTIVLKTPRGLKRILKKGLIFQIEGPEDKLVVVMEENIKGRPHERLRSKYSRLRKWKK